jgi:hypothetical protein
MTDFLVENERVVMVGNHAPVTLSDGSVEGLLDIYEQEGAADLFNRLYSAQAKALGDLHIPRVSSLRGVALVINNQRRAA